MTAGERGGPWLGSRAWVAAGHVDAQAKARPTRRSHARQLVFSTGLRLLAVRIVEP